MNWSICNGKERLNRIFGTEWSVYPESPTRTLRHLYTRLYFSDEKNENDQLLGAVDVARRPTLIAKRVEVNKRVEYHFDIHMQGENETVFFDVG